MSQPPSATDLPEDLAAAARTFFPEATGIASVPERLDLARVFTSSGVWSVRRWPSSTPESDLDFSHEVMRLAQRAGLGIIPELGVDPSDSSRTVIRLDGRLFDAQRWLPGEPPPHATVAWPAPSDRIDLPVALPAPDFSTVVRALADLHEATTALAATRGIPTAPLSLLPGAVQQAHARQLSALRPRARHEPSIQRWLATGERLMLAAQSLVEAAAESRDARVSVLHLNLWPSHVLLDHGALSGILGWERVAAGSPLLDLAQAILRLQGWTEDAVELALGDYGDVRGVPPEERRLLPAVAALDAVATTGRLLEQSFAGGNDERPPQVLRAGIDRMLRSMTALDRNLNAPTDKSRRRVWNRQRPAPAGKPKGGSPRVRPR